MERMFESCQSLISINFPNNFDTSNVNKMNGIFRNTNLNYYDINHFETHEMTDTQLMCSHCQNLVSLNLSNFNWGSINNMEEMFSENNNLKLIDFGKTQIKEGVNVNNIFKNSNNKIIIYINKIIPKIYSKRQTKIL